MVTHDSGVEGDYDAHDDHGGDRGEAGNSGKGQRGRVQDHTHSYSSHEDRDHGSQLPQGNAFVPQFQVL